MFRKLSGKMVNIDQNRVYFTGSEDMAKVFIYSHNDPSMLVCITRHGAVCTTIHTVYVHRDVSK